MIVNAFQIQNWDSTPHCSHLVPFDQLESTIAILDPITHIHINGSSLVGGNISLEITFSNLHRTIGLPKHTIQALITLEAHSQSYKIKQS